MYTADIVFEGIFSTTPSYNIQLVNSSKTDFLPGSNYFNGTTTPFHDENVNPVLMSSVKDAVERDIKQYLTFSYYSSIPSAIHGVIYDLNKLSFQGNIYRTNIIDASSSNTMVTRIKYNLTNYISYHLIIETIYRDDDGIIWKCYTPPPRSTTASVSTQSTTSTTPITSVPSSTPTTNHPETTTDYTTTPSTTVPSITPNPTDDTITTARTSTTTVVPPTTTLPILTTTPIPEKIYDACELVRELTYLSDDKSTYAIDQIKKCNKNG